MAYVAKKIGSYSILFDLEIANRTGCETKISNFDSDPFADDDIDL